MNNEIEVNGVPVTVPYRSISTGGMYKLPSGGTCVYMVKADGGSVNLRTGQTYSHNRNSLHGNDKRVIPLPAGTVVKIIVPDDSCRMAS